MQNVGGESTGNSVVAARTFSSFSPQVFELENFRLGENKIRAADAKEVGVGNPAEETYCYPNAAMLQSGNALSIVVVEKGAMLQAFFIC
jgi:hypothetical protein